MELILNNLRKTYGTVQALKGISYTFKPGIYGILGANGAGKSTMINLITDNQEIRKMVEVFYIMSATALKNKEKVYKEQIFLN